MAIGKLILITGATGKVARAFIARLLADARFDQFGVRALCHALRVETGPRVEVVDGSIEQRADVERATREVVQVPRLATRKETPNSVMDVAVKGLFWLLEATWRDNSRIEFLLGWRPRYDLRRMADPACSHVRSPGDPRVVWYPGERLHRRALIDRRTRCPGAPS